MPYRFSFRNDMDNVEFSCNLPCNRCTGKTKTGAQCSRSTCKYLPMCYQHLRIELGLKIAPSEIPGAGYGLFTTRARRRDEKIVAYIGEQLSFAESDDRYGAAATHPYALEHSANKIIDAACVRGAGAFANHKPMSRANCRFSRGQDGNVWIVSTKKINPDCELTVSYGPRYKMNQSGVSHRTASVRK